MDTKKKAPIKTMDTKKKAPINTMDTKKKLPINSMDMKKKKTTIANTTMHEEPRQKYDL